MNALFLFVGIESLGIQSPNLRMVMEPKYYAEEAMIYTNHLLRIWLDA